MTLDVIIRCKKRLGLESANVTAQLPEEKAVQQLAEEILGSIRFHFSHPANDITTPHETADMPSASVAAGLLLMHPLWVIATVDSVPNQLKAVARVTLQTIGRQMGVKQASLLGDVSPCLKSSSGHALT